MGRQSEFLIGLICLNAFAANNVIKLKTNQFAVLSEAGEASARRVLERVETARQVFEGVRFPITIVIFGSERTYAPFRLGPSVSGFHQSGPDRDWIGILNSGPETERIATHEFLHALMSRAPVRYPKWLEEGTAELYSNVEVRGDRIVIGLPIREHLQRLQAVSDSVLFGDRTDQDEVKNEAEFYAESWALAHMLHLSPGYRERMPAFIEALSGGTPAVVALRTFGKTPDQVIEDLRAYVRSGMPAVAVGAPERESYRTPDIEKVPEPDSLVMRAELLLLMGRNEAAERMYLDVAKSFRTLQPHGQDSPYWRCATATMTRPATCFAKL